MANFIRKQKNKKKRKSEVIWHLQHSQFISPEQFSKLSCMVIECEKLIAVCVFVQVCFQIEKLEEERVSLKLQIRKLAQSTGQKYVL